MERGHALRGVTVRVRELTGRRGDVFLCHPWLLHAASANAGTAPRFARSKHLYASPSARAGVTGGDGRRGDRA